MDTLLTLILIVIILIIFSAFFSASETAITAASREKIHSLILQGSKRAQMVQTLRAKKEQLFSTLLFGNNAVNILASALATSSAIHIFGDKGVVYATLIMTIIIVIFAEILPKTLAFEYPEKVALTLAPLLLLLAKLMYPLTLGVQLIIQFCYHKIHPKERLQSPLLSGAEALRGAIDLHHHEGTVVKHERDMLGGVLDLAHMSVHKVMVHRKYLVTINASLPTQEIIRQTLDSKHTRIPLWQESPDKIIGVLHVRDVLNTLRTYPGDITALDIRKIASPPWFIPDTIALGEQLTAFRKRRNHFALVINEYGSFMGAITLEDILEEIVGQIEDEHDINDTGIKPEVDGSYRIRGDVSLRDINRFLEWSLPDTHATTLAGLIMYETRTIPEEGELIEMHGIECAILHKRHHQLLSIIVRPSSTDSAT